MRYIIGIVLGFQKIDMLNKYFSNIYVISCESFKDRQEHIITHFSELGLDFQFIMSPDADNLMDQENISSSELSLIFGHMQCIQDAIRFGYDRILICEDDVEFIPSVNKEFNKFISKIPEDWKFLQLGNQFWATKWLRRTLNLENLYRFYWGTGSHCIAINSIAYDITLKYLSESKSPVDFTYYKMFENLDCWCPENFLADSLSESKHLDHIDKKSKFKSTIIHKNA